MSAVNPCPEQSAYRRLIDGELPPSDVERLSRHLEGCSACAAAVQTPLDEDTLLSAVRGTPADAPSGDEVPADLTRRLLALRSSADLPSDSLLALRALAPPQGADEIGRLAHFRVLRVLGQGGMGVVFLAEDTLLGRTVALKVMRPEVAAVPRHRQRFLHEARAQASVEHDHIVPIHAVGEDGGVPWLAMPLLKGQSLDELLRQVKVLNPAEAVRLGGQVARGLAAAHAAGLIHRDVKPANIWVGPEGDGRAKLLDFGLARDDRADRDGGEPLTRSGALVGTPAYMAPEQAHGEPLDGRADLFSLGCVLYRAVTGRLPFQGQGMMGTLLALGTETPPAPDEVSPAVPRPLSVFIMSLLAKDRSARPASASAVAAALEALQGKPTGPVPTALPAAPRREESDPWDTLTGTAEQPAPVVAPRRRWRLATAAALLLALGGALAAGIVALIKNKAKVDSVDVKPDRRAAEWVLRVGGKITIRRDGQERAPAAAEDLPADPFEVVIVRLENTPVDDAGLEYLKGLTNLNYLNLSDTRVSAAGLEHLKGLTNLVLLWLGNTPVGDAGLEHLKGLTDLKNLSLQGTRVSDAGLAHLQGLTELNYLNLFRTRVGDAGLVHLRGLTKLVDLNLSYTPVGDAGLAYLKGLTDLKNLSLQGTRVSDAGLARLKGLTNLTCLNLSYNTRVSEAGLEHLKGLLAKLEELSLAGTPMADNALPALENAPNLRKLDLNETGVTGRGLSRLAKLPKLAELLLTGSKLSDSSAAEVGALTRLERLSLARCPFSDAGLEHLVGLSKLTQLDLRGTQATADGVAALQKALPNCRILPPAAK